MKKIIKKKTAPKNAPLAASKKSFWLKVLANLNIVGFISVITINYQAVNLPI